MDLESGVEHFNYLADFPLFTVLNVNFVANFKLSPVPSMFQVVVVTNGPLVSVKFHFHHKNIAIFDCMGVAVNLGPFVL